MTLYLILAVLGGVTIGAVVMALFSIGRCEDAYGYGYQNGHDDGFKDGVKSIGEVG